MGTRPIVVAALTLAATAFAAPPSAAGAVAFDDELQLRYQGPVGGSQLAASVAVSDLDDDDRPDFLVGAEDQVRVFEADGDGGLVRAEKPIFKSTFDEVSQVIPAQLDSDGSPDVAITINAFAGSSLFVLLSNGDGTFERVEPAGTADGTGYVAAGDLNGDGAVDLAITSFDGVQLLPGDGAGGFAAPSQILDVPNATAVKIADLDVDGDPDVATTDRYGRAYVGLGDGAGAFAQQPATKFSTPNRSFIDSLEVGDVDSDAVPDLVVGDQGGTANQGGTYVLLGLGDGTFAVQPQLTEPMLQAGIRGPDAIRIADVNRDGDTDLVVAQEDLSAGGFSVYLGDGSGDFAAPITFAAHMGPSGLAVADIGGDDRPDVVGANYYDALSVSAYVAGGKRTSCHGETATFIGHELGQIEAPGNRPRVNDYPFAGAGDDVVSTGAGADIPRMGSGDDVACAGTGNDIVPGANGNDVLDGGAGADVLNGGPGDDVCIGGPGQDKFRNCERER